MGDILVPESNPMQIPEPGRWLVQRRQWFKNCMIGSPMVYTEGWGVSARDQEDQIFDTWREAMDYADRMARTVEVTLPRTDHQLPNFVYPPYDGRVVISDDGMEMVYVYPDQIKPLALILLAHHYSNGD